MSAKRDDRRADFKHAAAEEKAASAEMEDAGEWHRTRILKWGLAKANLSITVDRLDRARKRR